MKYVCLSEREMHRGTSFIRPNILLQGSHRLRPTAVHSCFRRVSRRCSGTSGPKAALLSPLFPMISCCPFGRKFTITHRKREASSEQASKQLPRCSLIHGKYKRDSEKERERVGGRKNKVSAQGRRWRRAGLCCRVREREGGVLPLSPFLLLRS